MIQRALHLATAAAAPAWPWLFPASQTAPSVIAASATTPAAIVARGPAQGTSDEMIVSMASLPVFREVVAVRKCHRHHRGDHKQRADNRQPRHSGRF